MKCARCGHDHPHDVTVYEYGTPNPAGGVVTVRHTYCRKCKQSVTEQDFHGRGELYPADLSHDS